jgi:hypothetical protein
MVMADPSQKPEPINRIGDTAVADADFPGECC